MVQIATEDEGIEIVEHLDKQLPCDVVVPRRADASGSSFLLFRWRGVGSAYELPKGFRHRYGAR